MSTRTFLEINDAVLQTIGSLSGKSVIDIGCGTGELCRAMVAAGANIIGIDPNSLAIEQAIAQASGAEYKTGTLQDFDFEPDSFDFAIFCTSLHHIPEMGNSLQQAAGLVKQTGKIIVVEPEADDPLYEVIRWIDDEKEVYRQAQEAIDMFMKSRGGRRRDPQFLATKYRFADVNALIKDMQQVDNARTIDDDTRVKVVNAYEKAVETDNQGPFIEYWYRIDCLNPKRN